MTHIGPRSVTFPTESDPTFFVADNGDPEKSIGIQPRLRCRPLRGPTARQH
jgi:hypothetical protein